MITPFSAEREELPPLNKIVVAKCKYSSGDISHFVIKRIANREVSNGWQWSDERINSYFALEVISWRPLYFLELEAELGS